MDENSSRFVDKLVMDKLVDEKLSRVHHAPSGSEKELNKLLFSGFAKQLTKNIDIVSSDSQALVFTTPFKGEFEENNNVPVKISNSTTGNSKARIILVHGLFEENRDIYTFLIKNLNSYGYHIYQTTLPFHYERKPEESAFGGEYFWSADIYRSRFVFKQGVSELYTLYNYLKSIDDTPVYIVSFSMGGGITMSLLSVIDDDIDKVFLMNPICSLTAVVWDSPLCKTIKQDLLNYGWDLDKIVDVYSYFDPATLLADKDISNKTAMVYGIYDMITEKERYQELIAKLKLKHTCEFHSGHLNLLRVPKLAKDIHSFFEQGETI